MESAPLSQSTFMIASSLSVSFFITLRRNQVTDANKLHLVKTTKHFDNFLYFSCKYKHTSRGTLFVVRNDYGRVLALLDFAVECFNLRGVAVVIVLAVHKLQGMVYNV